MRFSLGPNMYRDDKLASRNRQDAHRSNEPVYSAGFKLISLFFVVAVAVVVILMIIL